LQQQQQHSVIAGVAERYDKGTSRLFKIKQNYSTTTLTLRNFCKYSSKTRHGQNLHSVSS